MTRYRIPRPRVKVMACLIPAFFFLAPAHAAPAPPAVPRQSAAPVPQSRLNALLAKAAEYCRKLESAAFDFVCREEIAESVNPSLDAGPKSPPPRSGGAPYTGPTISIGWMNKIKRRFVYDYQCVRAGGAIRETRTLLEENGKKKVLPNAELATRARPPSGRGPRLSTRISNSLPSSSRPRTEPAGGELNGPAFRI